MIELAPDHKLGLPVACPVMLGAGAIGYGESRHRELTLDGFGAVVIGPFTRRSRRGSQPPRMAETLGGFVRRVDLQNRGVSAAVRKFAGLWPRLGCPVVAQLGDSEEEEAASTARRLSGVEGIEGFELVCSPAGSEREISRLLEALLVETDLPVLAKLPLVRASTLAPALIAAGAAGIVVGSPPIGAAMKGDGWTVTGEVFGPGVYPMMLAALMEVKGLGLTGSLIACGGIHTRNQALHCLAAGADALQLDSLAWVEPAAASIVAAAFADVKHARAGEDG